METLTQISLGIFLLLAGLIIKKSIIIPEPRWIMGIMFFGKIYRLIINIPGKKVEGKKGPIIDGEGKKWNFYFYPWPIFSVYKRPFEYDKLKKLGEEQEGDIAIWKNEETKEIVVHRSGITDHLEFRTEYPTITPNLDTAELRTVHMFTNNIIEIIDPIKAWFGIKDWFSTTNETLSGTLKGLVSRKTLIDLNKFSGEEKGMFNEKMKEVNRDDKDHPGLLNFGVFLYKSIYKDFDPADEATKTLMKSYGDVTIAEQEGKAVLEKQKGATAAFKLKTDIEIEQERKKGVQTGRIKVDSSGNVTELVPDPNTKIVAENMGKLRDLKGTLIIGGDTANMLNIPTTKGGS